MEGRKKIEKLTVLLFTMLIPVLLYLFLKKFGDNRFTVPVYYDSGVNPDTANCDFDKKPYQIDYGRFLPDASPLFDNSFFENKVTLIDLVVSSDGQSKQINKNLERVYTVFQDNKHVQIVSIRKNDQRHVSDIRENFKENGWYTVKAEPDKLSAFAKCGLILLDYTPHSSSWNKRFVLVDGNRRIRGYYYADDYDDIERLILEIKIILNEEY